MYNIREVDDIFFYDIELLEKQDSYFYKGISVICIITLVYLTFLFLQTNKLPLNRIDNDIKEKDNKV